MLALRDTNPLLIALGGLFAMIGPAREPIAFALAGTDHAKWTLKQKQYLWSVLKKYEFALNLIGVQTPPEPQDKPVLPTEPYFADFIQGKYVLRLSEDQAEHIDTIPKAKHDRKTGLYTVPQRMLPVLKLREFIKATHLHATEACKSQILWMLNEMRDRFKASKAHDADIDMGDFGLALDPYQKAGIKGAARCQRAWIADEMGLGKTRQGLGVAYVLNAFPLLIIPPASQPLNWQREAMQGYRARGLKIARVKKKTMPPHTCEQRQLSLLDSGTWDDSCEHCLILNADVVICNYDKLADGWKEDFEIDPKTGKKKRKKKDPDKKRKKGERHEVELSEVGHVLDAREFAGVIIDESHYIKEDSSQRTKATIKVRGNAWMRLALSGTPVKNKHKELIAQARYLDRMDDLGGTDYFSREFCGAALVDGKWDDTGSTNGNQLNTYMRSIGFIQRAKRDVKKELPPIRYADVWVEIDNREEYDRAEREIVQWCAEQACLREEFTKMIAHLDPGSQLAAIERKMIETRLRIMKVQALVKMNVLKGVAEKGKLSAGKEWIGDFLQSGKPLVCFAHSRDVQYAIGDAFNALHIYGKDSVTNRQKHRDIYMGEIPNNSGLHDNLIVCSFGAAKEGWNLDKGDDILLFGKQWTPPDEDQAIARIDRHRVHNVTAWRMHAEGTVEEKIEMKLSAKRRICEAVTRGERGPATGAELDSVWDVFSDLAAMSTNKKDSRVYHDAARRLIQDAIDAGPGALAQEAEALEATLEVAV